MLFELETIGDPDDGMISAYTGCVDGNGEKNITVIKMYRARDVRLKTVIETIVEDKKVVRAVNKFIDEIEEAHKKAGNSKLKFD
jgi:hypothetical protein